MYKVLIRPELTYASETWTVSKTNERRLSLFERKVLRCIFGAKQEKGAWRKRYNYELYEMFNESNIVNYIKVKRLAWAGHLVRMNNDRTLKKYLTPNQMEQEVLEDRNCDGRMVLIKI
jgi:hypothetical protein